MLSPKTPVGSLLAPCRYHGAAASPSALPAKTSSFQSHQTLWVGKGLEDHLVPLLPFFFPPHQLPFGSTEESPSCAWHPAPPASRALGTMGPGSSSEGRRCYFQRDARLPDSGWHGQQIGLGRGYFCISLPPHPAAPADFALQPGPTGSSGPETKK